MKIRKTTIEGLFIIDLFHAEDNRGGFVKTFHKKSMEKLGLNTDFQESFYSVNNKGVIRGMHFQIPPHDHDKLVYCNNGSLIDVVLDIRKDSPTYGKHASIELSGENYRALYLAKGLAHGFESLEDHTMMTYLTSTMHAPSHDSGIRFDSFGKKWNTENPIVNERDLTWPSLDEFESPF
jgi:dTDP-4-dehydrorhamnose 3,5-epimerase/CDP-3, 6-dideoxy-D-glycero-D-glycero-4-hexulose-5-epimerase